MHGGDGIHGGETPDGWRDLAAAIPECVGVQADGTFVYAADELAAPAGLEADDLEGADWRTPFDAAEAARLERDALATARADGRWSGAVRFPASGGDAAAIPVSIAATGAGALAWLARDTGGAGAGTAGANERPATAFLRSVLDADPDAVCVSGADGRQRVYDDALPETTGYARAELDAMGLPDLVPDDRRGEVAALFDGRDADGDASVEAPLVSRDGDHVPHEFSVTGVRQPATGERVPCVVVRDIADDRARERRLERYETIVDTVDDGIYALDEDLQFSFVNDGLCDLLGLPRSDVVGADATEFIDDEDAVALADDLRSRAVDGDTSTATVRADVQAAGETRVLEARYRLHPEPDDRYRGSVGVVRDVTDRLERERRLERKLEELATLDRITELLLATVRELTQTTSREAVERTICERLTASDRYAFAWVGERALDDAGRVRPREQAGDGPLDDIAVTAADSDPATEAAGRAMRTGVVQSVDVDDLPRGSWRTAARERGFESVAAVPLQHREAVYGVLVVCATHEGAFSPRERDGFDVLGRTVGAVIYASRSRELLFADAVVELEFRFDGDGSVFAATARERGCELSLDGYVAADDGWLLYVTVDGERPEAVAAAATDDPRVESARTVRGRASGGRLELAVTRSPLLRAVLDAGAAVRDAAATPSDATLVVDAPADADIRGIVDHVLTAYSGAELLARRRHDRDLTAVGSPAGLLDGLTDRQREALEAAYRAGYFSWPRESTAEDVAASLGVAAPTLHAHLRKAEARLLRTLLDGAAAADRE